MTESGPLGPGRWLDGELPGNVRLGPNSILRGEHLFERFRSRETPALVVGAHGTFDGVEFALGEKAKVTIGDYCYFTNARLLCEAELRIGSYVVLGWNAAVVDADSPARAPARRRPVVIGDGVWVGPNALILEGVHVAEGAFVEPGAVVAHDVPPRARVLGNPARVVGEV